MEQRTLKWKAERLGKITASNISKIMGVKGLGKTGQSYLDILKAEKLIDPEIIDVYFDAQYESWEMRWGTDNEPIAREYYSKVMKEDIQEVGFKLWSENENVGCSADGINEKLKKGYEIKCPATIANHYQILEIETQKQFKKLKTDYYWQMMLSMLVYDFRKWQFISFHPFFKDSHKVITFEIAWDEDDINLLKSRLSEATAILMK